MKRITLIVGHYGSGKTEFSVNHVINLKKQHDKVAILDMEELPVLKESCILKSRQYDKEERFREYIKLYEDILEADKQG